jgi:peptidoglycan/xylan/chitin deacetylase (PgdA/CDA1 family)
MKLSAIQRLQRSWQKNRYEIMGLFNGGLPRFIFSPGPGELGPGVPVFCYHTIAQQEFLLDLQFLQDNGYTTLTGDDLLRHVHKERLAPARSVVLTFDDGARNFYQEVFPLLQRFQMHAMAFVAPGMHFETAPPGYEATHDRPMTWSELRELHVSGLVDVESHTYESRYLPRWPLPVALSGVHGRLENALRKSALPIEEDLRRAKLRLEAELPGKVVRHLAFPDYDGTDEAIEAAVRCGYAACHWGIRPGQPVNPPGTSAMHIARVSHEYLRRLPGKNRATLISLVVGRAKIVRTAWSHVGAA